LNLSPHELLQRPRVEAVTLFPLTVVASAVEERCNHVMIICFLHALLDA